MIWHRGLTVWERRTVVLGACCWTATGEFFLAQAIAQTAWPAYSAWDHDISFLGALSCGSTRATASGAFEICSPLHDVMNGGIAILGLLNFAGALLTWKIWPAGAARAAMAILAISAIGPVMVAIWPMDTNALLHAAGAVLNFLVGSLGVILLGAALARRHPIAALLTLLSGALSLAGFALFAAGLYGPLGRGGMERLAGYPQTFWYMGAGVALILGAVAWRPEATTERN